MVSIPPEVQIKSSIKPGSVYYFPEKSFSSQAPYYFIVLNYSPLTDEVLLLVCSSSQIEKVRRRRRHLPIETLVDIGNHEYSCFTVDSIVDCNNVFPKPIDELIRKRGLGELDLKGEMAIEIVEKLRAGVLASPLVNEELKDILTYSAVLPAIPPVSIA